jgi:hypothetical protein
MLPSSLYTSSGFKITCALEMGALNEITSRFYESGSLIIPDPSMKMLVNVRVTISESKLTLTEFSLFCVTCSVSSSLFEEICKLKLVRAVFNSGKFTSFTEIVVPNS